MDAFWTVRALLSPEQEVENALERATWRRRSERRRRSGKSSCVGVSVGAPGWRNCLPQATVRRSAATGARQHADHECDRRNGRERQCLSPSRRSTTRKMHQSLAERQRERKDSAEATNLAPANATNDRHNGSGRKGGRKWGRKAGRKGGREGGTGGRLGG